MPDRHGLRTVVIGIDVRSSKYPATLSMLLIQPDYSIWLVQTQFALHAGHAQAGENPELRCLFYKLAHLLQFPITPLFVFDGAARPSVKRSKNVVTKPNWLIAPLQELLDAFGFPYYTASII
jgi:hypothetical protein